MAKKILAAAVIVPVALAGLQLTTARMYEQKSEELWLQQADYVTLLERNTQLGVLGGSERAVVRVPVDSPFIPVQAIDVVIDSDVSFYPGWLRSTSTLQFNAVMFDGELVNINDELGLPELLVTGGGHLLGLHSRMVIPANRYEISDGEYIEVGDITLGSALRFANNKVDFVFGLERLNVQEADHDLLQMNGLTLRWQQQGDKPYWTVNADIQLQQLAFNETYNGFSLEQFQWQHDSVLTPANWENRMVLSAADIDLRNKGQVRDVRLDLSVAQMNGEAAANLLSLVEDVQNGTISEDDLVEALVTHGQRLLAGSPRININEFSFNMVRHMAYADRLTGFIGFDGQDLDENFVESLLAAGYYAQHMFMSRLLMEVNAETLERELLQGTGMPADIINDSGQQLSIKEGAIYLNGHLVGPL